MSAVKSLAATSSAIHTDPYKKVLSTCFSREQKAWNGKPLSTTAIVTHKVRLKGEFGQGVNSQGGMHKQVTGQRLKNKNLLLYEMQPPSAALNYLLPLQTLQLMEMAMWKD